MDKILLSGEKVDSSNVSSEKPYLLYLTTTEEKKADKLKNWEESRLSDDKILVAVKPFTCYILDEESLEKDDPIQKIIKKHHAPSFIVMYKGEMLYGSGSSPSSSKLMSVLERSASKVYGVTLSKLVKKGLDIKKDLDKLQDKRKLLDEKIARTEEKDAKRKKYAKELEEIEKQEQELKAQEQKLFAIEVKTKA